MTKNIIHTAIIGASGRGKSYTILNEFLKPVLLNNKKNRNKIKCLILDIEREYNYKGIKTTTESTYLSDLKNNYKVCRIIPAPARRTMNEKEKQEYYNKLYSEFLDKLRNTIIIIDEIHAQGGRQHKLNAGLERLFLQGRKRGIKLIIAGQRVAIIDKTILGQCRYMILKGQNQKADWKAYSDINAEAVQYLKEKEKNGNIYATVHILDGKIIKRC